MRRSERSSAEAPTPDPAGLDLEKVVGPNLNGVVADANAVGLRYVVIGGFSVMANGFIRATNDSDLLVPDGPESADAVMRLLDRTDATRLYDNKLLTRADVLDAEHLRLSTRHGIIDIMHGGEPPLDFDTVASRAIVTDVGGEKAPVASLPSVVGFKRLAGRPGDRRDLEELEAVNGPLPIEPIPGLDD